MSVFDFFVFFKKVFSVCVFVCFPMFWVVFGCCFVFLFFFPLLFCMFVFFFLSVFQFYLLSLSFVHFYSAFFPLFFFVVLDPVSTQKTDIPQQNVQNQTSCVRFRFLLFGLPFSFFPFSCVFLYMHTLPMSKLQQHNRFFFVGS